MFHSLLLISKDLLVSECKSFAIPGDRRNYIEDILGLGNVTRPCPPGTLFNNGDCMCTDMDNNPPSRLDG